MVDLKQPRPATETMTGGGGVAEEEYSALAGHLKTTIAKVKVLEATGALDVRKALGTVPQTGHSNDGVTLPLGGIRFIDACHKYNVDRGLLNQWVALGHVRILLQLSRKFMIVDESDVAKRAAMRDEWVRQHPRKRDT